MYFGSALCFMPSAIDLAKRALVSLLRGREEVAAREARGPAAAAVRQRELHGRHGVQKRVQEEEAPAAQHPREVPRVHPIESFWGWLRQAMRRRDLEDLRNKRPALGKTAWTVRLKRLLKTQKAQTVAKRKFQNFKKVCKVVYQKKGAHSGL